ncbi:MAG: ATP-binding cassette domain-containing protein [Clostridiales bacterium]|nr:ATP-binding cassette domain-containing protein [Clostridiales bacterium]
MNNSLAVTTTQLTKVFSGKEIIRGCNISVQKETIYGFLGKNGAGKTTVFKLLLGLLSPTSGKATVLGLDSVKDNIDILRKTGSLIETPIFYEHISARENLKLHLNYMKATNGNIEEALKMVGLSDISEQPVSTFSIGMRQRLAIARALVHKPELLILDEPMNGLDPMGIKEMRELFSYLVKHEKYTILLSSHILSEIEKISDSIGFIVDGKVVEEITPEDIKIKHHTIEDYFMKITNGGFKNEKTY